MLNSGEKCCICDCTQFGKGSRGYAKCLICRHEIRLAGQNQSLLVNEKLDRERMIRLDIKVRFQVSLVRFYNNSNSAKLIDIGCGPGRFLYHMKPYMPDHLGVEITPACLKFAKEQLKVSVSNVLPATALAKAGIVTLWHSLEHFPEKDLKDLLCCLSRHLPPHATVIVSVPNVESLHWRVFGTRSTYYDPLNHPHQFSSTSLLRLFKDHGFQATGVHVSIGYSFLGAVLSGLNFLGPHNLLYRSLQRDEVKLKTSHLFFYCISAVLLSLPAAWLFLYEKFFPKRAGVLTLAFSKD